MIYSTCGWRKFLYFDWISFLTIQALSLLGLLFIFSATYSSEVPYSIFFKKQLFGIISGTLIYILIIKLDEVNLLRWGYISYFIVLGLLLFTLLKGSIGLGAKRWINLGIIKFQPSELAKLFFPPFSIYYLKNHKDAPIFKLSNLAPLLSILVVSSFLILKQPDLGTAIIVFISGITLLWLTGIKKKFFIYSFVGLLITSPLLLKSLKPYQRKRIEVFFGEGSKTKERYQIEQSKIAIGSGGISGKGICQGTQNRLNFLPESRTDFIFSVICEEWGILGALLILILYLFLFCRVGLIILHIQNIFDKLLVTGLFLHIAYAAIINLFMVTGMLPTVGIPLPFLSYGITNLWICYASMAWISNIASRT